jgi:hypothetical protein
LCSHVKSFSTWFTSLRVLGRRSGTADDDDTPTRKEE